MAVRFTCAGRHRTWSSTLFLQHPARSIVSRRRIVTPSTECHCDSKHRIPPPSGRRHQVDGYERTIRVRVPDGGGSSMDALVAVVCVAHGLGAPAAGAFLLPRSVIARAAGNIFESPAPALCRRAFSLARGILSSDLRYRYQRSLCSDCPRVFDTTERRWAVVRVLDRPQSEHRSEQRGSVPERGSAGPGRRLTFSIQIFINFCVLSIN